MKRGVNLRIMGLDVGTKNIGVAVSDPLLITATGVDVIKRGELEQDILALAKIRDQYQVKEVVMGLPRNMNGSIGPMGKLVQEFAAQVEQNWQIKVILQDERLSSTAAEKVLIDGNVRRQKRKKIIDKTAAIIILQTYLEKRSNQKRS